MCSPFWKLSIALTIVGILWKLPHVRHDRLVTPFLAPLPSLEDGEWAENSKSLLVASTHPGAIHEPTQSPINRTRDAPHALIMQEFTRFQKLCARNWGQRPICLFSTISQAQIVNLKRIHPKRFYFSDIL